MSERGGLSTHDCDRTTRQRALVYYLVGPGRSSTLSPPSFSDLQSAYLIL